MDGDLTIGSDLTIGLPVDTWDTWDTWDSMPVWATSGSGEWDDHATWDDMLSWDGAADGTEFLYTSVVRDLGSRMIVYALVDVESDDQVLVQMRYSADASSWSIWGDPTRPIDGRYVQIRVRVVSADPPNPPSLVDINTTFVVIPRLLSLEGISTLSATGANRYGVGDIRVPVDGFSKISIAQVTITGGPAEAVRVVDKAYNGPRLQFFQSGGLPAEATFDLFLRGYPNA
jgi:hypothetical protein